MGGLRQAITCAAIFVAVVITFSTLQFTTTTAELNVTGIKDLEKGAYTVFTGEKNKPKLVLFFSSTCPHCEKVIKSMQQGTTCTVSFNPVSKVTRFPLTGLIPNEHYDIGVNRAFMSSLDRTYVPILLVDDQMHLELIGGGNDVMAYLDKSCRPPSAIPSSQ
jgi:thiol-disulfide isomerase/thioredoxin